MLSFRFYMHGYKHRPMPALLRRVLARTRLHRAWLSGRNGYFDECGVRYGLCNPYGR